MDMCCKTCKYFHMGECRSKDFKNSLVTLGDDGYSYTEQGYLYEALKESNLVEDIIATIWADLAEKDILKRNRSFKNYSSEDVESDILESIDGAISGSINNYFTGEISDVTINDSDKFYCCYWE